jgi:hypothetical protein
MKDKKFRKSRPFDRAALFPKKVMREEQRADPELFAMEQQITRAFPDKQKRLEYIHALINAMED